MAAAKRFPPINLVIMGLGCLAFAFIGWRYNMPIAAIVVSPLLMRFFRESDRWYDALLSYPLLVLGAAFSMWNGWDLEPPMVAFSMCIRPLPFILPLFLDRWARKRLPGLAATLVYPASMVAMDFALSFTPVATVLSGVVGLFGARELAQTASIAGIWGLGFVVWWLAPALNALTEARFDARAAGAALFLPLACACAALAFGAVRIATDPFGAPTVRVAGVTADHPRDYWNLIDEKSPRDEVLALRPEAAAIQDRLFERSAKAREAGARIVVWSEGACVLDEENEGAFVERAAAFALDRGLYLAAGVLTFRYGSGISDNKVLMFTPEGKLAFSYVKTVSWYPTGSDGIPEAIDTPYGRIGAAICFDMDDPRLARRLAGADIVLVPAYDTERIRPFHTEVGLFRAIENGYSVFRQVAEGSSMAVDGRGIVRSFQDYFATSERIMFADLPMKGERAFCAATGDAFAWLDAILLAALAAAAIRGGRRRRDPVTLARALSWGLSRAFR
jgi:apolipoprotein N-acyltransferase